MRLQGVQIAASRVQDNFCAGNLAHASVRPAEHSGVLDAPELVDAVLDFLREEFEPRHEHDGLFPALEVKGARLIQPAEVARQEPAVTRNLLAKLPRRIVRGEE